jgi:hypothetical protein
MRQRMARNCARMPVVTSKVWTMSTLASYLLSFLKVAEESQGAACPRIGENSITVISIVTRADAHMIVDGPNLLTIPIFRRNAVDDGFRSAQRPRCTLAAR